MEGGTTSVWNGNWVGLCALYDVLQPFFPIDENLHEVSQLRADEGWNVDLLSRLFLMTLLIKSRGRFNMKVVMDFETHHGGSQQPQGSFIR